MKTKKDLLEDIIADMQKLLLSNEISLRFIDAMMKKQPERTEIDAHRITLVKQREDVTDQLEIALSILQEMKTTD